MRSFASDKQAILDTAYRRAINGLQISIHHFSRVISLFETVNTRLRRIVFICYTNRRLCNSTVNMNLIKEGQSFFDVFISEYHSGILFEKSIQSLQLLIVWSFSCHSFHDSNCSRTCTVASIFS